MAKQTNNGKKGGALKGKSHDDGGIKAIVTDTGQPVELEGGEVIINKAAAKKHCKELSLINQSAGGGVPIPCDGLNEAHDYFKNGGQLSLFDADIPELPEDTEVLNPDEIETKIVDLEKKYGNAVDILTSYKESEKEEQRAAVLEWIKNPANNVKVLIAFSGGKDSVAMVLRAIYEWKIPKHKIQLWHHDVDGDGEDIFDWKCTKSYCNAFAKEMGVEILYSFSGGGIVKEILRGVGDSPERIPFNPPRYDDKGKEIFKTDKPETRQPMYFQEKEGGEFLKAEPRKNKGDYRVKGKFPAVSAELQTRWCSSVAKIEVMARAINHSPSLRDSNLVIMTGERRQESNNRAKYNEIERYARLSKKSTQQAITWRSVIDMTEKEVWELYRKYKIQPHPCYELGWGRCSCQMCIFSTPNIWASNNELSPDKVKRITELEEYIKYPLYFEHERIPFSPPQYFKTGKRKGQEKLQKGKLFKNVFESKVQFGTSFINKEVVDRWKDEALGEFTSPIIVKGEWKLPLGAFNGEQAGAN